MDYIHCMHPSKASYELATRLPRPGELFGDGVTIQPSLCLEPETSRNANAALASICAGPGRPPARRSPRLPAPARAYELFGVQKPGRALYVKLTAEY